MGIEWLQKIWGGSGTVTADSEEKAFRDMKVKEMGKLLGHRHEFVFEKLLKDGKVEVREFEGKLPGTALATTQMIGSHGTGPMEGDLGKYEVVMYTKVKRPEGFVVRYNADDVTEFDRSYFKLYLALRDIMDKIGRVAQERVINPKDMIDIECEVTGKVYHCVFDRLKFKRNVFELNGEECGFLLAMLVFESEYMYAKNNGVRALMNEFKKAGIYPYSNLKRKPLM